MTPVISETQRISNVRFEQIIIQRDSRLSPQAQAMTTDPRIALHNFYLFQQTVSTGKIQQHRNELARVFTAALRNCDWSSEQSALATPIVDWLLSFKNGRNMGGYLKIVRPMVLLACNKLQVPQTQKDSWNKAVKPKDPVCPKGIGAQTTNALPRPILRGMFGSRD